MAEDHWDFRDKFESAVDTLRAGIQTWYKQAYPYAKKEQPLGMLRREDILAAVRMLPGNEDLPEWKDMDAPTKVQVVIQGGLMPAVLYGTIAQAVAAGMSVVAWAKLHPRGRVFAPYKWKTTKEGRLITTKVPEVTKGKILPKRFIPARLELKEGVSPEEVLWEFTKPLAKVEQMVDKVTYQKGFQSVVSNFLGAQKLEVESAKLIKAAEQISTQMFANTPAEMSAIFAASLVDPSSAAPKLMQDAVEQFRNTGEYAPRERELTAAQRALAAREERLKAKPKEVKLREIPKTGDELWADIRTGILKVDRAITEAKGERIYSYWDYLRTTKDLDRVEKTEKEVEFVNELLAKKDNEVAQYVLKRITAKGRGYLAKDVVAALKDWDKVVPEVEEMKRRARPSAALLGMEKYLEKALSDEISRLKEVIDKISLLDKVTDEVYAYAKHIDTITEEDPLGITMEESIKIAVSEYGKHSEIEHISEETAARMAFERVSRENWEDWELQQIITPPPGELTETEIRDISKAFDVNLRAQLDSSEHWSMSYEKKTGVPVYSGAVRPIIEAGKLKNRDNRYYNRHITGIFEGLSRDDIADLTLYMKEKHIRGAPLGDLPLHLQRKETEIRAMFDYGFRKFKVSPETYIINYMPLLSARERERLATIPVNWRGIPSEVIPFFRHARERMGEIIDAFTAEELLRLYFSAGTWSEYRKEIHRVGKAAKGFPMPAFNEVKKLEVFLTGGVSDFDKAIKTSIRELLKTSTLEAVEEDADVMTALVNTVYLGTIAGNPGSAIKNLTQSFHNWSEMPAHWMAVGNKLYFSKEGQNIIKNSGIQTGFAPYVERQVSRYYGKSIWKKGLRKQAQLRNMGMFLFQSVDHYNRGTIYLAEWSRMNHFVDLLKANKITEDEFYKKTDFAGLHPVIQDMAKGFIKAKEWETVVDMVADQRQVMTQWRYQREVRPQWMRTGIGKLGGQFMTWPTYGVVFHAGRYKRAAEAFGEGETREGLYQLWKEIKWLGMAAVTIYAGKKAGVRLWPWFMFLPTQALAAAQPGIKAYQAAVLRAKGYDWIAGKRWREAKWSAKILAPFGVELGNIVRSLETGQPLRAAGLPVYPAGEAKIDLYKPATGILEQWEERQAPKSKLEEWEVLQEK